MDDLTSGEVVVGDSFVTKFIPGIFNKKDPRLDVIAPMTITYHNTTKFYIVLFRDRGDAVLEKSYASIKGENFTLKNINILPGVENQEYRIDVLYDIGSIHKEIIIPINDGNFLPLKF